MTLDFNSIQIIFEFRIKIRIQIQNSNSDSKFEFRLEMVSSQIFLTRVGPSFSRSSPGRVELFKFELWVGSDNKMPARLGFCKLYVLLTGSGPLRGPKNPPNPLSTGLAPLGPLKKYPNFQKKNKKNCAKRCRKRCRKLIPPSVLGQGKVGKF